DGVVAGVPHHPGVLRHRVRGRHLDRGIDRYPARRCRGAAAGAPLVEGHGGGGGGGGGVGGRGVACGWVALGGGRGAGRRGVWGRGWAWGCGWRESSCSWKRSS